MTVLYPIKGVSELTRFTPEAVSNKYGLTPTQYPDFAALRGDPSDNLPGIPGVGEKTATKWIVEYGSLQSLVDNVDQVKARSVTRCAPTCLAWCSTASSPNWSRTCHWPRRRTPCGCSRGTATRSTGCSTTWSSGCCAIGCSRRWPPRIPRSTRASTCGAARWSRAPSARGWPNMPPTADVRDWRWWAPIWRSTPTPSALAIATADGEGAYIDTATMTAEDEAALGEWLADRRQAQGAARGEARDPRPRRPRLDAGGVTSDTALAAYLVRPGQRSFALDDLSLRYLRRELRADNPEQQQLSLLDDERGRRRSGGADADPAGQGRRRPRRRARRRAGPHRLVGAAG